MTSRHDDMHRQLAAYQEELTKTRNLVQQCEDARQAELERTSDLATRIVRLTEANCLLQSQLDANEQQVELRVTSLERRLQVANERLRQYHEQRNNQLSDVEDRLLNENIKLKVSEKEAKRQIDKLTEQCKLFESKLNDARNVAEANLSGNSDQFKVHTDISRETSAAMVIAMNQRISNHKFEDDMAHILSSLNREFHVDVTDQQQQRLIWLIWNQREDLAKQLQKCELALSPGVMIPSNCIDGDRLVNRIKALLREVQSNEKRFADGQFSIKNVVQLKEDSETEYKLVVDQLVKEKHSLNAQLQSTEDQLRAMAAAHEALQQSVQQQQQPRHFGSNSDAQQHNAAQFESMKQSLHEEMERASQFARANQLLEAQCNSLQAQVNGLQKTVTSLEREFESACDESEQLRAEHRLVLDQHSCVVSEFRSQITSLESEIEHLNDQIQISSASCQRSEEQVNVLKAELQQKHAALDETNRNNEDLTDQVQSLKHQLQTAYNEQISKDSMLKQKEYELETCEQRRRQSDMYCRQCDSILSKRLIESLKASIKLPASSSAALGATSEADILAELTTKYVRLNREKDAVETVLEKTKDALEKLTQENAELMTSERSLRQQLANEHVELYRLKCNRIDVQQQMQSVHTVTTINESSKLSSARGPSWISPRQGQGQSSRGLGETAAQSAEASASLVKEIASVKRQLDSREKEIEVLRQTVENQKQLLLSTNQRRLLAGNISDSETNAGRSRVFAKNERTTSTADSQLQSENARLRLELEQMQAKYKDSSKAAVKSKATVDDLEKFYAAEKTALSNERLKLEAELSKLRNESADYKEQLRLRDQQIEMYVRMNRELEEQTKQNSELLRVIKQSENDRTESIRQVAKLKAQLECQQAEYKQLELVLDQYKSASKSQNDDMNNEMQRMRNQLKELKLASVQDAKEWELERAQLIDQLETVCQSDSTSEVFVNRPAAAAAAAAGETKFSLSINEKRSMYGGGGQSSAAIESLYEQLMHEVSGRKAAELRAESLQKLLDDLRNKKFGFEATTIELRQRLDHVETELNVEKEKYILLKQEMVSYGGFGVTNTNHGTRVPHEDDDDKKMLHIQTAELQAEISSLRRQTDMNLKDFTSRMKHLGDELKHQQSLFDKERIQLVQDAERARSRVQQLERELRDVAETNQSHEREVTSLKNSLRESRTQLSQMQESLIKETKRREELTQRNVELEVHIVKLETRIESDADVESTRKEVSRKICELSQHMEEQFDAQRELDLQVRQRESQKFEEFRIKISSAETALHQEQSMHNVTKAQLASVKEDNQKLRQQLQAARKRASNVVDIATNKSRMEEISEIIARSQLRAQRLLAAGSFYSTYIIDATSTTSKSYMLPGQLGVGVLDRAPFDESRLLELTLCSPTSVPSPSGERAASSGHDDTTAQKMPHHHQQQQQQQQQQQPNPCSPVDEPLLKTTVNRSSMT